MPSQHPRKRIGLFIPCFNVEHTLPLVLARLPLAASQRLEVILIVDNQSSDATRKVAQECIVRLGLDQAKVYCNVSNYLLGGSTVVAFDLARQMNLDFLICLHSDGQADALDVARFISVIDSGDFDFVLGSRLLKDSRVDGYSRSRYLFNLLFAYLQQPLVGQPVFDLGAYVAFNIKTLTSIPYHRLKADMGYHPYLISCARQFLGRKLRIHEFPIAWGKVETSHINPVVYGLRHAWRLARLAIGGAKLSATTQEYATEQIYPPLK